MVTSDQQAKWDTRWRDARATSASVVAVADAWLPGSGRALDLAGGVSGDALAMAGLGLDVTVADISPVALAGVSAAAAKSGLSVATIEVDLESAPLPSGPWDVVTVGNFFAPAMLERLAGELAPGAVVAVVVATETNLERNAHPSARFLAAPGQIQQLLVGGGSLELLHASEAWRHNGRHEAHVVVSNDVALALVRAKDRWRSRALRFDVDRLDGGDFLGGDVLDIEAESARLCRRVLDNVVVEPGQRVLVYDAMASEATLAAAISGWGEAKLALTRTPDSGPLTVHPFDAPREQHRFGYSQPSADAPVIDVLAEPDAIAAVLVPGLAFDRFGGRLGRGRGYYDRLLSAFGPRTLRVGIAFDQQVVHRVPTEGHDVVMTHLATPSGFDRVGEPG